MSTRALPKISQIPWTSSGWTVHSSEETLFIDNMSPPCFILPGTFVAFSERRLFWAHTRRPFASVQSDFEARPPWWFMYDTTDLLSERISTWCPQAGRIDRPNTLLAILGSWCAGPTPLRTTGWRSVCLRTALPNPSWKRLSWHPSFCAPCLGSRLALARPGPSNGPGLIHRPESLLRGGVHNARPGMEPSASTRTGWVACEANPTEVPAKPLP